MKTALKFGSMPNYSIYMINGKMGLACGFNLLTQPKILSFHIRIRMQSSNWMVNMALLINTDAKSCQLNISQYLISNDILFCLMKEIYSI